MGTRWMVTGSAGQVGHNVHRLLSAQGADVVACTRADLDVTDAADVVRVVGEVRPDVVLNCAAYTAVDAAETDETAATAVNSAAPAHLAAALAVHGGRLVHVSTDYVFDGASTTPYEPGDPTGPRTAYGRTKLAGERAALAAHADTIVVRTAWVYGGPGPNFVDTMRRLEGDRDTVDVVCDQVGSPTWAADLAAALIEAGGSARPGVVHYANAGTASWFDLARAVFAAVGADPDRVRPTTSARFVRPAPRPAWSVLSTASWTAQGLTPPRPWRDALTECLAAEDLP